MHRILSRSLPLRCLLWAAIVSGGGNLRRDFSGRRFRGLSSATEISGVDLLHWHCHSDKSNEKKRSEETQTLCAGCTKAEPKIFALPQTPFPGAGDGQNLISWRWSLRLPSNAVWWGSMHAISSYHGNRLTHKHTHTHTHTHRQDRLQYTVPQLARSVITMRW